MIYIHQRLNQLDSLNKCLLREEKDDDECENHKLSQTWIFYVI